MIMDASANFGKNTSAILTAAPGVVIITSNMRFIERTHSRRTSHLAIVVKSEMTRTPTAITISIEGHISGRIIDHFDSATKNLIGLAFTAGILVFVVLMCSYYSPRRNR